MDKNKVFVVKERVEELEKRIETALDESGLKEFSKHAAKDAIKDLLEDITSEIKEKKTEILNSVAHESIDVEEKFSSLQEMIDLILLKEVSKLKKQIKILMLAVLLLSLSSALNFIL